MEILAYILVIVVIVLAAVKLIAFVAQKVIEKIRNERFLSDYAD